MRTSGTRVLFVCSANVCRSPRAAALLHKQLEEADLGSAVRISSAGVRVPGGTERCGWLALDVPPMPQAIAKARPRALTADVLNNSALVLAADRDVMSAVIRQAPRRRNNVFTIKEAAALGLLAVADPDRVPAESPTAPGRDLSWLVDAMNERRGALPVDVVARRRQLRRAPSWSKTLDVPDAHSADTRIQHRTMWGELAPAAADLGRVIIETLTGAATVEA